MKPKYNTAKFRNQTAGATLVTAIVVCLSGTPAFGVDNFWTGTTNTDWNTATNWSLGRVPVNPNGNVAPADTFDDAVINTQTPNIATITANPPVPRDYRVGQGADTNGRLDVISGSATTGGGNWAFVGRDGGTGVFNLANTAGTGGTLTGFAQGSGSMTCNGSRLYVGGANDGVGGGNGTFFMNTSGSLTIGNDLVVGARGATGMMKVDSGTITTGGWNFIGRNDGANGANGTLIMGGGTLTNTGRTYLGEAGCTGTMTLSGGSYLNVNNEIFVIGGEGAGGNGSVTINNSASLLRSNGEFWVGQGAGSLGSLTLSAGSLITDNWTVVGRGGASGTVNLSGGTFTKGGGGNFIIGDNSAGVWLQTGGALISNGEFWVGQGGSGNGNMTVSGGTVATSGWMAVGRESGTGVINMSGGTWTHSGTTSFIVGTGGTGSGTMTLSGGTVEVLAGETWIGEGGTGTFTLNGSGIFRAGIFQAGRNGGSNGTVNLDGGTLRATRITGGGGADHFHFNGTQIVAAAAEPNFINNIDGGEAFIDPGGLKIDSNGFDIGSNQGFNGAGGVVKSGAGKLSLLGSNSYSGSNIVNAGELVTTTRTGTAPNSGDYSLADGTALGISQLANNQSLSMVNATFGGPGGTTLNINLGNIGGNPTAAPLDVSGALTLNGPVTINISDLLPTIGTIPLVSYVGTKVGTGSFVLGTLPNGVVGTFSDNGAGLVSLNVTSASLPRWKGTVTGLVANGVWDIGTTQNWTDMVTTLPTTYTDPAPVLFPDNSNPIFTPNVTLDTTVKPSKVTFTNSVDVYTLAGTGKISDSTKGPTSLLKQGTAPLTISNVNDFTGVVTLEGGTTSVTTLANGGSPSAIGASTAAASNLLLSGGTLSYTGPATSTDRGFTIAGVNSGISVTNDVTLSGPVATFTGNLNKTGAGNLTLTYPGANIFGSNDPGLRVNEGTLTLSGGGTQTNAVSGELWIAATPVVSASLVLNNTSLTTTNWISMGRGNGNGAVATLTATNSSIVSVNFSAGYNAGQATNNNSDQFVTLTNTTWTNNGQTNLAESFDSYTKMVIGGTSSYITSAQFRMALGANSVAEVIIQDSGTLTKTGGWLSIGNSGSGSGIMTVKDSGSVTADNDFNVGDIDTSTGVLNIQNSATVTSTGTFYVAKNAGTTGTTNLDGGTLNTKLIRGGAGNGTFNFNGGLLKVAATGFNADFMSLVTTVNVGAGGARIDTNGNNIAINQSLLDGGGGGGLIKSGLGTLTLNGLCNYTGTTLINAGTLAGNGDYTGGLLTIAASANLNPGTTVGTLYANSATFAAGSTLTVDIAATPDKLAVTGALNISGAALVVNGTPTLPAYVIASYGAGQLTGTFTGVSPALPAGYSIDYNYLGNNEIAITRPVSAYETWTSINFPGETNPAIIGTAADPDGDGSSNIVEFALDGDPNSGASSGKVVGKAASVGGSPTLVLTLPVRTGATFSGATEQVSALIDGVVYRIQGSDGLATWNLAVSEVTGADKTAIEAGMPALTTGWQYRTFQSPGTIAGDPADFLRAVIENP